MNTAVAFIIFRRPDTTARVFERIRQARPPRLYIIADGPRPDKPGEAEAVAAARAVVADNQIDWDCQVMRIYSEGNLGLQRRIVSGLDQVFEAETRAIILEDDTLPSPAFFLFCETLLERFEGDTSIGSIIGSNFLRWRNPREYSYFLSRIFVTWGWATWHNRWKLRDMERKDSCEWLTNRGAELFPKLEVDYWRRVDRRLNQTPPAWDSWGFPWQFNHFTREWLVIQPTRNLILNLGHGASTSTHTTARIATLEPPLNNPAYPLVHPASLVERPIDVSYLFVIPKKRSKVLFQWARKLDPRSIRAKKEQANTISNAWMRYTRSLNRCPGETGFSLIQNA